MKRVITLLLLVIMAVFTAIPCYAASSVNIYFTNSYKTVKWSNHGASCTLTKPGKKNASVKATFHSNNYGKYSGLAVDVLMKDECGRVIWAEDDSIVAKKSLNTSRTYKLGKDHKEYRLFFRPSKTSLAVCWVTVSTPKNCTLKDVYDYSL